MTSKAFAVCPLWVTLLLLSGASAQEFLNQQASHAAAISPHRPPPRKEDIQRGVGELLRASRQATEVEALHHQDEPSVLKEASLLQDMIENLGGIKNSLVAQGAKHSAEPLQGLEGATVEEVSGTPKAKKVFAVSQIQARAEARSNAKVSSTVEEISKTVASLSKELSTLQSELHNAHVIGASSPPDSTHGVSTGSKGDDWTPPVVAASLPGDPSGQHNDHATEKASAGGMMSEGVHKAEKTTAGGETADGDSSGQHNDHAPEEASAGGKTSAGENNAAKTSAGADKTYGDKPVEKGGGKNPRGATVKEDSPGTSTFNGASPVKPSADATTGDQVKTNEDGSDAKHGLQAKSDSAFQSPNGAGTDIKASKEGELQDAKAAHGPVSVATKDKEDSVKDKEDAQPGEENIHEGKLDENQEGTSKNDLGKGKMHVDSATTESTQAEKKTDSASGAGPSQIATNKKGWSTPTSPGGKGNSKGSAEGAGGGNQGPQDPDVHHHKGQPALPPPDMQRPRDAQEGGVLKEADGGVGQADAKQEKGGVGHEADGGVGKEADVKGDNKSRKMSGSPGEDGNNAVSKGTSAKKAPEDASPSASTAGTAEHSMSKDEGHAEGVRDEGDTPKTSSASVKDVEGNLSDGLAHITAAAGDDTTELASAKKDHSDGTSSSDDNAMKYFDQQAAKGQHGQKESSSQGAGNSDGHQSKMSDSPTGGPNVAGGNGDAFATGKSESTVGTTMDPEVKKGHVAGDAAPDDGEQVKTNAFGAPVVPKDHEVKPSTEARSGATEEKGSQGDVKTGGKLVDGREMPDGRTVLGHLPNGGLPGAGEAPSVTAAADSGGAVPGPEDAPKDNTENVGASVKDLGHTQGGAKEDGAAANEGEGTGASTKNAQEGKTATDTPSAAASKGEGTEASAKHAQEGKPATDAPSAGTTHEAVHGESHAAGDAEAGVKQTDFHKESDAAKDSEHLGTHAEEYNSKDARHADILKEAGAVNSGQTELPGPTDTGGMHEDSKTEGREQEEAKLEGNALKEEKVGTVRKDAATNERPIKTGLEEVDANDPEAAGQALPVKLDVFDAQAEEVSSAK